MLHGQFEAGAVLANRYRIVSLLGKGGMGEVYRADDLTLKEPVALKILPAQLGSGRDTLFESLRNEVRQARMVSHQNVCRVHDLSEYEDRQLVSMEFIEGEDLASLLRRIGRLPFDKAIQLARQLAAGMSAAHQQGVLHLDLKPANLMIDRRGDVKISDFGLARLSSTAAHETRIAGTPAFMAPEQALGHGLSPQTDIYAFGLILFNMLTGQRAFSATNCEEVQTFHRSKGNVPSPSKHRRDLNPDVDRLVCSCLEADPASRPQSFEAILKSLGQIRIDETVPEIRSAESGQSTLDESDIYLSYAPVDDQPLSSERQGWITQLHRNLEIRVEQLSGRQVRVFRPPLKLAGQDPAQEVLESLPGMKAMVSVLSPPFVNNPGCMREVEAYWESQEDRGQLYADGHTRVLKVVKAPVEYDDLKPDIRDKLQDLLGFEFFDYDPESGRLREYSEWYGAEAEQRFHERIYDIAQELHAILKAKGGEGTNGSAKTIYLATTTSDILPLRDRVRRELLGRGHRVVPEKPLPFIASEAETAIRTALAESDLAIHPFGSSYGVIPEGSDRSLASLQNELAAEHSKHTGLLRIIWIPNEVTPEDARQEELFAALKEDPDHHRNAEIVINTFQTLKPILLDKLSADEPVPARGESSTDESSRPRRIYLICDPKDEDSIEPLEDYLFDQGFDLSLPDFGADETEAAQNHRENLQDCDAVIIYYGTARSAWVDIKLRNIIKMSGYGREQPLAFNAIYVAPPFDRRKERYRTHSAKIVRQEAEFDPSVLEPLLAHLQSS